jgi:hypothetical protein
MRPAPTRRSVLLLLLQRGGGRHRRMSTAAAPNGGTTAAAPRPGTARSGGGGGTPAAAGGGAPTEHRTAPLSVVVTDAVRRWYEDALREAERGDVVSTFLFFFSSFFFPHPPLASHKPGKREGCPERRGARPRAGGGRRRRRRPPIQRAARETLALPSATLALSPSALPTHHPVFPDTPSHQKQNRSSRPCCPRC